jgi:hypothetical protein
MRANRIFLTPLLCLLLLAPAIVMAGPPATGQAFTTTTPNILLLDLGTLGGTGAWAHDLNPSGVVAGHGWLAGNSAVSTFSYDLLASDPMVILGALPGETHSHVRGITDGGVIIGYSGWSVFTYDTTATDPTMTALPVPTGASTNPWMTDDVMNDAGGVVGWWGDDNDEDFNYRAYAYDPGTQTSTDLGAFGNDFSFEDMNTTSAVGYRYMTTEAKYTGFVQPLDGSTRIDLNTQFGWDESLAYAISDDGLGLVVGSYCDDSLVPDVHCSNDEWTGFAWDQVNDPVDLPLGVEGQRSTPELVNDAWIIAEEQWPSYAPVAYSRSDLTQPPVLLDGFANPESISDADVVVGRTSDWTVPAVYDLAGASPQLIPLPTLTGSANAYVAEHVDGHIIVVGGAVAADGYTHAVAWVVGVPDAPTIALVADGDGIAPVGSVTADATPTLAGSSEPSGPVVVRAGDGTVLTTVTADATGAWSWTSPTLVEGTYEFTATHEPATGWPSNPAAVTVTVEIVPPPTVTVGTPKVAGSTVTVPFTIEGTYDPASLTCQLDDTTPVPCASTTEHTFTEVVKGDHVVTVSAATPAGRIGQGSAAFTVKAGRFTEPAPSPTVLTVTITDATAAKNGPVTATFEAQAGTDPYTFACTLVGGTTTITEPCTSPWTYPTDGWLAGGRYELSVTVTDGAAGTATDTATVNVPGTKR